jgi:hypothetical protein
LVVEVSACAAAALVPVFVGSNATLAIFAADEYDVVLTVAGVYVGALLVIYKRVATSTPFSYIIKILQSTG